MELKELLNEIEGIYGLFLNFFWNFESIFAQMCFNKGRKLIGIELLCNSGWFPLFYLCNNSLILSRVGVFSLVG